MTLFSSLSNPTFGDLKSLHGFYHFAVNSYDVIDILRLALALLASNAFLSTLVSWLWQGTNEEMSTKDLTDTGASLNDVPSTV